MADVKKVLVVDDHFEMLEFLQSMLELSEYDYDVLAVPSAEEGMLELGRTAFDLLITDVRLPGMSGFDFVRKARVRSRNTELPVIMITAYASEQGRQEAEELGVYRYFTKPFGDTDEVITAVNQILYGTLPAPETGNTAVPHINLTLPSGVEHRLRTLTTDTGAALILLATKQGQMLIETGAIRDVDTEHLASIISSNLINSKQLTQQLGGDSVTTIQYHAGEHLEMYTANIGADYFMSIIFDVQVRRGRFGTIWVFTQRAIKDLLPMLPALPLSGAGKKATKTAVTPSISKPAAKTTDIPVTPPPKRRRGRATYPDNASAGNIERAAKPRPKKSKTEAAAKEKAVKPAAPPPPDFFVDGDAVIETDDNDALGLDIDDLKGLLGAALPASPSAPTEDDSELVQMDTDALKDLLRNAGAVVGETAVDNTPPDLAHLLELDDVPDDDAIDFGASLSATADEPPPKQDKGMSFEEAQRMGLIGGAVLPADTPASPNFDELMQNVESAVDLDDFWNTAIASSEKAQTSGLSFEEARRQGFISDKMS